MPTGHYRRYTNKKWLKAIKKNGWHKNHHTLFIKPDEKTRDIIDYEGFKNEGRYIH